jgi:hypothetical protein
LDLPVLSLPPALLQDSLALQLANLVDFLLMLANQLDYLLELSIFNPNKSNPVPLQDLVDNPLANLPVLHQDSLKHPDPPQPHLDHNNLHHKPDLFPSPCLTTTSNPKLALPNSLVPLQDLQVYLNNLELFKELPLLPMLVLVLLQVPQDQ